MNSNSIKFIEWWVKTFLIQSSLPYIQFNLQIFLISFLLFSFIVFASFYYSICVFDFSIQFSVNKFQFAIELLPHKTNGQQIRTRARENKKSNSVFSLMNDEN